MNKCFMLSSGTRFVYDEYVSRTEAQAERVMICLHGLHMTSEQFEPFINNAYHQIDRLDQIPTSFIAINYTNFGVSLNPNLISLSTVIQDLHEFFHLFRENMFPRQPRIYLIAYSLGTYLLFQWLARFPEDCSLIVRGILYAPMLALLSPTPLLFKFPSWGYLFCVYFKKKVFPTLTKWAGIEKKSFLHHKFYQEDAILGPLIELRGLSAIIHSSIPPHGLQGIQLPMDLVFGEYDQLSPIDFAPKFQKEFPQIFQGAYLLPKETHLLFQRGIEKFNHLIFFSLIPWIPCNPWGSVGPCGPCSPWGPSGP